MYERSVLLISGLQGTGAHCVRRDIQIEMKYSLEWSSSYIETGVAPKMTCKGGLET